MFTNVEIIIEGMSALAMMEVTNPPLHTLFILRLVGKEGTLPYVINAIIFVLSYFIFRIVGCGYLTYRFYHLYNDSGLFWTYHSISFWLFFALTALSYFWFWKIIQMATKAFGKYNNKTTTPPKDTKKEK